MKHLIARPSMAAAMLICTAAGFGLMRKDSLDLCQETYDLVLGRMLVRCTAADSVCPQDCRLRTIDITLFVTTVACGCTDGESEWCHARVDVKTGTNEYLGHECLGMCLIGQPTCNSRPGTAADNEGLSLCWCHF